EHAISVVEPLATLGDSLALSRESTSASGFVGRTFDVGPYEIVAMSVIEVDAQGRQRRRETFAADRLGDAIVRLYERYAQLLPDGPERARAAAIARSVAVRTGPLDLDCWAAALAPGIESVDHRTLGTCSAHGAEEMLRHLDSLRDLSDDVAARIDDILALRTEGLLVRRTAFGTDRASGGSYERPYIVLEVFGDEGLLTQMELFDSEHDAEALAGFDEVTAASQAVSFENAATRLLDRFRDAWETRDWERVAGCLAPGYRRMDRRKMVRIEFDRDAQLESLRLLFEMRPSRWTDRLLATRDDRLALARTRVDAEGSEGDAGPRELEILQVLEVDDRGDAIAIVVFDP